MKVSAGVNVAGALMHLFWLLVGLSLMVYGWRQHDLRYELLGGVVILDTNNSAGFANLRRAMGLRP